MRNLTPLVFQDRLDTVFSAAFASIALLIIALVVHAAISKNNRRKQIHGRPICWWIAGMTFVGWCVGIWRADNRIELFESGGMGGFGLLIGLVVGHIHGSIRLARLPTHIEDVNDQTPTTASIHPADSANPYAPLTVSKQSSSNAP